MSSKNSLRWSLLAGAVATVVSTSRSEATTLPLTNVVPGTTNTYSYTTSHVADPNASYTGGVAPDGAGYYGNNTSVNSTLSYTFDLAPHASNLNLTGASLFANAFPDSSFLTGPTNGVSLDYTLSGGNSGSGNLFTLLTSSFTPGGVETPAFNENIPLTAAITDTIVTVTFTSTSTTGNDFQEQLLRSPQAFVATASFTPEPASLGLLGMGALSLMTRRRRA